MVNVLVETISSAMLLAKLLSKEEQHGLVEIRTAAPASSLYSAARTLLAVRGEPVVLLLDADSTVQEAVDRRQQVAEEVIGEAARSATARVLIAVPALEALLFLRPGPVARAFGASADGEHLLELGRLSPREALKRLNRDGLWWAASYDLIAALDNEDVAELRFRQPIDELLQFVSDLESAGIAASSGS